MSSGAYTEEPPGQREHSLVTDEMLKVALKAYDADTQGTASAVRAALDAVAGDLWQAGFDAAIKVKLRRL